MDYVLGVDGGATKTTVNIADLKGRIILEAAGGSSNYKSVGESITQKNLVKTVLDAMSRLEKNGKTVFKSACFGIAGNDYEYDLKIYKKIIFDGRLKDFLKPEKTMICNDSRIGLEAGSANKNRIMVICGTGSNCFGINQFGDEAHAGGWDYILGDEGSGYLIGYKALRAVMRAYDGRSEETILGRDILKYLNLKHVPDIANWVYGKDILKKKIAGIAGVVCQAADQGDRVSKRILHEEAKEVEIAISTLAAKLNIGDKDFDLVMVGRVFECEKHFKNVLFKMLKEEYPKINFKPLTRKPVLGAIKLAIQNL